MPARRFRIFSGWADLGTHLVKKQGRATECVETQCGKGLLPVRDGFGSKLQPTEALAAVDCCYCKKCLENILTYEQARLDGLLFEDWEP
jgi:hypothetical protein